MSIQQEAKRISHLAPGLRIISGRRLPVVKITRNQYSSQQIIQLTCQKSSHLICCHGHSHPKRNYFPKNYILVDVNPVSRPDLLGNIKDRAWISLFPANHFESIDLSYIPPPAPFSRSNHVIYRNLLRLLKPGGRLISHYMFKMNLKKMPDRSIEEIRKRIESEAKQHGFSQVQIQKRSMVVLIK